MPTVTVESWLPAPVHVSFAYIADSCNDPKWCPLVRDVEQTNGHGPGPGATYTFTQLLPRGRSTRGTITVDSYDADRHIAWDVEDGVRKYQIDMQFRPHREGTHVIQTSRARFKGWRAPLLALIMPLLMKRALTDQFRRLRAALEEVQQG